MKYSSFTFKLLLIVSVILQTSCEPDPCSEVNCGEHGQCIEGTCLCDEGYEGDDCSNTDRDKFEGNFVMEFYSCGIPLYGSGNTCFIRPDGLETSDIAISNFGGLGCPNGYSPFEVLATIDGVNLSIIPNQSFCGDSLVIVSGNGVYDEDPTAGEITIEYEYIFNGDNGSCTLVCRNID